jgi:hypothetical protein
VKTSMHYSVFGHEPIRNGDYSISSVQFSDAEPIRKWRNEQITALRQQNALSKETQAKYFDKIISEDFTLNTPPQVLVRFCLKKELIGYGGIVHIDWINLRGEVSFLLETERTLDHVIYSRELNIFFELIKELGFQKLGLNKLSTEAYAHRGFHVNAIENAGFQREGILRQQTNINGVWIDAVVASCLRSEFLNS